MRVTRFHPALLSVCLLAACTRSVGNEQSAMASVSREVDATRSQGTTATRPTSPTARPEKETAVGQHSPATTTDVPRLRRDGKILMVSRPSEGRDLIVVDRRSGNSRILVDGDEIEGRIGNAAWSSDGRWLAYDVAPEQQLWFMNARDGARALTLDVGPWAWSPTGAQLAIISTDYTFTDEGLVSVPRDLILLDPSTGRLTDLGPTIDDVTTGPVWAPDASRIVYGVRGGSVYSIDPRSGDRSLLVRLQGTSDSIDGIDWSQDGTHIAVLGDALYVMRADGTDVRVVAENIGRTWGAWLPDASLTTAWSPDGTRLAYENFARADRELRIWTVSLDDSSSSLVASYTNPVCCQSGGAPVWSPDGSRIAFAVPLDAEERRVGYYVVNATRTGRARAIDELTYLSWRGGWYFCFCYG
jgi:Tol biopolymer transport system component